MSHFADWSFTASKKGIQCALIASRSSFLYVNALSKYLAIEKMEEISVRLV